MDVLELLLRVRRSFLFGLIEVAEGDSLTTVSVRLKLHPDTNERESMNQRVFMGFVGGWVGLLLRG